MEFFSKAIDVLQLCVIGFGAGLGIWGLVNLFEAYANDNPGANAHVNLIDSNPLFQTCRTDIL